MNFWILKFTSCDDGVYLDESIFDHTNLRHVARRGQRQVSGVGSFSWSSGLKSLCLLIALTKEAELRGDTFVISGVAKSEASRLDYALSKTPSWLLDMFGTQEDGTSIAQLLFQRRNPERKRNGPVHIWFDSHFLPLNRIEIYVDGFKIYTKSNLTKLIDAIRGKNVRFTKGTRRKLDAHKTSTSLPSFDWLKEDFRRCAKESMASVNAFSSLRYKKVISDLFSNSILTDKLNSKALSRIDIDHTLAQSASRHIQRPSVPQEELSPVCVGTYPGETGVMTILHDIKQQKQCPLEFTYNFISAGELAEYSQGRTLDVVFLPPSVAHKVLNQNSCNYTVKACVPSSSFKWITNEPGHLRQTFKNRSVYYHRDGVSSGDFALSFMEDNGLLSQSKKSNHLPVFDQISWLPNLDYNETILTWFPMYSIARRTPGVKVSPFSSKFSYPQFMLVHRSMESSRRDLFLSSFYSAWLRVACNQQAFLRASDSVFANEALLTSWARLSGLALHME